MLRLSEEALREQLGAVIRERRKALGLTLAEMAKRTNVSLGYLSQIEWGKTPLRLRPFTASPWGCAARRGFIPIGPCITVSMASHRRTALSECRATGRFAIRARLAKWSGAPTFRGADPRIAPAGNWGLISDPPPDLAIEVDITHRSLDRMAIHGSLRVPEVRRHDAEGLAFFTLNADH